MYDELAASITDIFMYSYFAIAIITTAIIPGSDLAAITTVLGFRSSLAMRMDALLSVLFKF